jgi:rhodanese-related sulfurtransferase
VHDQTRLVPYRGALRGAVGVLMDRQGNSLDRALLLAELLRKSGHAVRLARATLTEEQAGRILADRPAPKKPSPAPASASGADEYAKILAAASAEGPRLAQALEEQRRFEDEAGRRIDAWLAEQTAALLDQVLSHQGTLESRIADLRDHWWVQVERDGTWNDLDPTLSVDGAPIAIATETHAPDALAEDLFHTVTLTLSVEFQDSGGLREAQLLEARFRPMDELGKPITIYHHPMNLAARGLAVDDPGAVNEVLSAITEEWAWAPLVRIGDRLMVDRFFTLRGEVHRYADWVDPTELGLNPKRAGGLLKPAETAFDLFGNVLAGIGGAGPDDAATVAEDSLKVTAEWLDITISVPQGETVKARRAIFDLLGSAKRARGESATIDADTRLRRALALLGTIDVAAHPAALSPDFAAVRLAEGFGRLFRDAAAMVRLAAAGGRPDPSASLPRLALPLMNLAAARSVSLGGTGLYLDQPNVILLRQQAKSMVPEESAVVVSEIDIVHNRVAALPELATHGFVLALLQGVTDSVLETFALNSEGNAQSTAALFARDLADGKSWRLLTPADAGALQAMTLTDAARSRLSAALSEGDLIVLRPEGGSHWWRIDPNSGTTLGIAETGAGQSYLEHLITLENVGVAANYFDMAMRMAGFLYCATAAAKYAQESSPSDIGHLVKVHVYAAVCAAGHMVGIAGQGLKLANIARQSALRGVLQPAEREALEAAAKAALTSLQIDGLKLVGSLVGYGANGLALYWQFSK